jgi:hypothetical protein
MEFDGVESLEAGVYTLVVKSDRGDATCTAVIDDGGILLGGEETLEGEFSSGGQGGQPVTGYYPRCSGSLKDEMTFGTDEDGRIVSVGMRTSPDSLDLKVSRDDEVVLFTHVEFQYAGPEPGCTNEPCRQATETVVIPR